MPKQKPAHWKKPVSVTLSPSNIEALKKLALAREVSVSSILDDLLLEMQPVLISVADNITYLKTATVEQQTQLKQRFVDLSTNIDNAYSDLASQLGEI